MNLKHLAETVSLVVDSNMRKKHTTEIFLILKEYDKMEGIPNKTWEDLKSAIVRKLEEDTEQLFKKTFFKAMFPYQEEYRKSNNISDQNNILIKAYGSLEAENFLDDIRYKQSTLQVISQYQKLIDKWKKSSFKKNAASEETIHQLEMLVSQYQPITELMLNMKNKIIKGVRTAVSSKPIDPKDIEKQMNYREFMSKLISVDNYIVKVDIKSLKAKIKINGKTKEVKLEKRSYVNDSGIIIDYFDVKDEYVAIQIGNGMKIHHAILSIVLKDNQWLFGAYHYTQWRNSPIAVYDWWDNVEEKYRSKR